MYQIKTEDVYEDFNSNRKIFLISVIIQLSQNAMIIQTNQSLKDETEALRLKNLLDRSLYSFLVDNSEHKKVKDVKRNVAATASHNEYKNCIIE